MKAVCCCVVVVLVLLCGTVYGSLCPEDSQPFTENVCLTVVNGAVSFSNARSNCEQRNVGNLATFSINEELLTASSYVSALGTNGDYYWTGYLYNGAQLEDIEENTAPSFVTDLLVNDNLAGATGICIALNTTGHFVRMNCVDLLGYVCLFTLTDPSVSTVLVNNSAVSGTETVSIGANVSIACTLTGTTSTSVVEWTFNGVPVTEGIISTTDNVNVTELLLSPFLQCGEYQCIVTNTDGQMSSATIKLFGDIQNIIAPPTPVNAFGAYAQTQTSLFLQWNQPDRIYTISPFLVSYTLYYTTQAPLNYSASADITNLRVGSDGKGSYILEGLQTGTVYYLGMRAENGMGISNEPAFTQLATTYGNAPSVAPSNLMLSRNNDDTALLAEWTGVITTLPTGRIVFYQVEFRDTGARETADNQVNDDDTTVLFIGPRNTAASIFNVRSAQGYEVRVAAAVQVQRSPAEHELSPFSGWKEVEAIVSNIPVVPTIQFVEEAPSADSTVVIVSTVIPIVVASILTVVIVVIIAVWISRKKAAKDQPDGYVCTKCKSTPFTKTEQQEMEHFEDEERKM